MNASLGRPSSRSRHALVVAAFGLASLLVFAARGARAEDLQRDEKSGLQYLELETGGASAKDALPMVVAIHGLGDNPAAFQLLLDDLPARARVIVPRGPMPHGKDGFSWFDFHADDEEGMAELGQGIRASADRVAELVVALQKKYGGPPRVVVCGFSQGGMLSFALAAEHPELLSEAVPVSGSLPVSLWPKEPPKTRPLPKVFALHGESDKLIPVTTAKWSIEALRSQGYDTKILTYPGVGHALSHEMHAALIREVSAAVDAIATAAAPAHPSASTATPDTPDAGAAPPPPAAAAETSPDAHSLH